METFIYEYFLNPSKRVYWGYILSSILIASIYLYYYKNDRRVVLSKKLWLHKSVRLDVIYFFISYFIKITLILPLLFGVNEIALSTYRFLVTHFGFIFDVNISYNFMMISYTLTIFLLNDFSRYFLHRFMHENKFLWRFHKIHHSAKVLNPLTFYRVHPVENILFGLRYSIIIGVTTGIFIYFFGSKIDTLSVLGANIFLFVFSAIGSNLRHSHIKLGYFKILEYIFISPKQHQIHHSNKYYNKNYGSYLAIWDYIFNTLQLSKQINIIKFGLNKKEMKNYQTILSLLFTPFNFKENK